MKRTPKQPDLAINFLDQKVCASAAPHGGYSTVYVIVSHKRIRRTK